MSIGQNGSEPTVGQLVANASRDLSALVRGEIKLAQAELKRSAQAVGVGAGMFAAAAFLALLAVVLLSISAAFALVAAGLGPAVAFLVVAGAYLLIGTSLVAVGIQQMKKAKGPERAIESSKESVEQLKAITRN